MDVNNLIYSTAGAIPFINDKGDVSMQKVKVQRYITGKRPAYAPISDHELSEDENDMLHEPDESFELTNVQFDESMTRNIPAQAKTTPRPKRVEPEIIYQVSEDSHLQERTHSPNDSDENDLNKDTQDISFSRKQIRQRLRNQEIYFQDLLDFEDEISDKEHQLSSEYEDYTDSEEDVGPLRLKPFFVKKSDRITIPSKEDQETEDSLKQCENLYRTEQRKIESKKILEEILHLEKQKEQGVESSQNLVITDDENDEIEYEAWKVRELRRVKKAREEIERLDKERQEIEKIHLMNDRERAHEFDINPRFITNSISGEKQYKFLQKHYHRGSFFLDKDDDVYKRDFSKPTLEDHFNKQVLPKVMQVKNFGRSGRTKYTHLLDQDTTQKDDNPWGQNDSIAIKNQQRGGGMKQYFERPTTKKIKLRHMS